MHRVEEDRNIIHAIKRRKGRSLCRNCLLMHVAEGRIKVMQRRGRRGEQLLDNIRDRRGHTKLKEEALGRTPWRTRFERGYGPIVRQTTE
jgi:Zn-finger protein